MESLPPVSNQPNACALRRDRAIHDGDLARAARIERHNLGTVKRARQASRWHARVRTVTYQAVNQVAGKACLVAAEDLTKPFTGRKKRSTAPRPRSGTRPEY